MVHLKTVYVTNLVFSLETMALYFVTSNKLEKSFVILIIFLQEKNPLSIIVTDFPDTLYLLFIFLDILHLNCVYE